MSIGSLAGIVTTGRDMSCPVISKPACNHMPGLLMTSEPGSAGNAHAHAVVCGQSRALACGQPPPFCRNSVATGPGVQSTIRRLDMKKRFTEERIICFLREAECLESKNHRTRTMSPALALFIILVV